MFAASASGAESQATFLPFAVSSVARLGRARRPHWHSRLPRRRASGDDGPHATSHLPRPGR